jgi:hypothetical protein
VGGAGGGVDVEDWVNDMGGGNGGYLEAGTRRLTGGLLIGDRKLNCRPSTWYVMSSQSILLKPQERKVIEPDISNMKFRESWRQDPLCPSTRCEMTSQPTIKRLEMGLEYVSVPSRRKMVNVGDAVNL